MLNHKHINKICSGVLIICLLITALFMNADFFGITESVNANTYEQKFFEETTINTIDIIVDSDEWHEMLDNASEKEYITCDLVINGEQFTNIAIRTKGNSSLQQVQSSGSDRYSFKIEFDHYDSTMSYYGLDKLCLNNIVQDNTYMKDYLGYTLMNEFGVASPLVNYTNVSINGEDFGLYLAVEAIEDAFLQRNYGTDYGTLYKPETSSNIGGGGNAGGGESRESGGAPDISSLDEETLAKIEDMMASDMSPDEMMVALEDVLPEEMMQGDMGGQRGQLSQMPEDMAMPEGEMQSEMAQGDMGGQRGQLSQIPEDMAMPEGEMQSEMAQGDMGGQRGQLSQMPEDMAMPEGEMPESGMQQGGMSSGREMSGGMSSSSSSSTSTLSSAFGYDGDDAASYSYIFDNAVTKIDSTDQDRLIDSIEQLNEQENLEEVVDVEQLIRYYIVHNFLLNFDSYTGGIMHNYYLYEEDGVMTMLPWDYNLSFVSFQTSYSTEELANFPIDTPVSSGTVESRPMLSWIFSSEEYTELYHELFAEFIDEFFVSGYFENEVLTVEALIDEAVENDTSKFCTYEQFTQGVDALIDFVALRVESIQGQLAGTIGSTSEAQAENSDALISTGDLDVTDTGSESVQTGQGNIQSPTRSKGGSSQMGGMGGSSQMGGMPQGESSQMGGMPQSESSQMGGMAQGESSQMSGGQMPEMSGNTSMRDSISQATQSTGLSETQIALAGSAIFLILGFAVALIYKRRK